MTERTFITATIEDEAWLDWRPDPAPGSPVAVHMGCPCPLEQPEQASTFTFATDCPVHVLGAAQIQ